MSIKMNIDELTEEQAKKKLKEIIEWLDELDQDDFFGTEGWKHLYGIED